MQQELNSNLWLSPNGSQRLLRRKTTDACGGCEASPKDSPNRLCALTVGQFFLSTKLLLECLEIGLLSFTFILFLSQKLAASAMTGLESPKLVVVSSSKNSDSQEKTAEAEIEQQQVKSRVDHQHNSSSQHWRSNRQLRPQNSRLRPLRLKLQDTVVLALQNNRTLKNAYLQRIIDRENLEQEEDKFVPDFIPQVGVSFRRNELGTSTNTGDLELGTTVSIIIPTGAELQLDLIGIGQIQSSSTSAEDFLEQNFSVSFNQPLLQRFGTDINQASIKIARIEEQQNLFQLKSTLIDTISSAVIDYRALVQAQEELKIQQQALKSSKRQLEITQAFIDAGRRARVDLIPNQTAVANREVNLLAARNRLQETQLQLLQTLDLNHNLELIALETPEVEKSTLPSPTEILELALANNPNYLSTSLDIETAELNLALAEDDRRWDLSLNFSYDNNLNSTRENSSDFRSSVNLNREFFGNDRLKRAATRSQILLQQNENNLAEARASLEIQVQNSIREVDFRLTEVEQARRVTQLSQQQLENEREKLRLGRGSIIDAIRFEEDLVNAANQELNAVIAYLNAVTRLEQTIGITLETWNVTVEAQ